MVKGIKSVGHRKEIQVLTFGPRSDERLTFETSTLESLYGDQFPFSYQLC